MGVVSSECFWMLLHVFIVSLLLDFPVWNPQICVSQTPLPIGPKQGDLSFENQTHLAQDFGWDFSYKKNQEGWWVHALSAVLFWELFLEADPRTHYSNFSSEPTSTIVYTNTSFLHALTREDSIDFNLVAWPLQKLITLIFQKGKRGEVHTSIEVTQKKIVMICVSLIIHWALQS